ncbi:hypothetical protein K7X08_020523 [Anisodus acutangulus]|uniref:AP2/ERF domain-containing protein n=1 Tax=Anisodus acutangulus TaxID=402998 RepID=A0A9Q1REE2_9SOLA|nr:hypothetical protein K7X08_020523 [Anisodus acutangulus]
MSKIQENKPYTYDEGAQIRSSLSQILLTSTNTLDSIFSHCQEPNNQMSTTSHVLEPLAYAYDRAAYKLRGEYARLNFPKLRDPSELGYGDSAKMNALKSSVDAKIQAICQKVKRERAQKGVKKIVENEKKVVKHVELDSSSCSSSSLVGSESWSDSDVISQSSCEDGFLKSENSPCSVLGDFPVGPENDDCYVTSITHQFERPMMESEYRDCSLARIPSFDPELIWAVLAN